MADTNIQNGYHHKLDIPPHTEWDLCTTCDNESEGERLPPNTAYTCDKCGLDFITPPVTPAAPVDKTPRSTWMKENGIEIQWTHVCGDPFQLDVNGRVRKPEAVQFCIILRNTKGSIRNRKKKDDFDRAWFATGYTMGSGLFKEMVDGQRKLRSEHTFKVGMDDLRKKYLKPDIESFLSSLIMDLHGVADGQTFEEFVDEFGLNIGDDQRAEQAAIDAHHTWKALQRAWKDMIDLIGPRKAREFAMLDIEDDYR